MTILLTGAGRADVPQQFYFVSTGTSFSSGANIAIPPYTAVWMIEGATIYGVTSGSVALTGDKSISFGISPSNTLTKFDVSNQALSGVLPSLDAYQNLALLFVNGNVGLTGAIPSLSGLPLLQSCYFSDCGFTGPLPSLAANPILADFRADNMAGISGNAPSLGGTALSVFTAQWCGITGVVGGFSVPASCLLGRWAGNFIPQAGIDAILAAFVTAGASGGTLALNGGGNATPSATGLSNKATLVSRGWTVTNN
jgi:hypothetical protein